MKSRRELKCADFGARAAAPGLLETAITPYPFSVHHHLYDSGPPRLSPPRLAAGYGVTNGTSSAETLSVNMLDYWISFATSSDPNDGRGSQRTSASYFRSLC